MVEVSHLVKKYDGKLAVDDISFTLLPGTIYGLLGPNGAGKSTTMNMMTGYIAPSQGSVLIDGHDIYSDGKEAKKRLGYLPENPPLYQEMTVYEYLVFAAELKGMKKEERMLRVEEVMEEAGLLDVSDKLIRSLSKGYKQRVGFAQAVINSPEVIILDEPTVGLDPKQIIEFREMIKALGQEHIVLLSSHILSEISAVCDHVFIINGGKLIVDDDVDNLDNYVDDKKQIEVTIKGDADAAKSAIEALSGVTETIIGEVNEEGQQVIDVTCDSDAEDITEQISMALMEQRIPILGMQEHKGSLEQIFLEITQDEPVAEDETGEESAADGEAVSEDVDEAGDVAASEDEDETGKEAVSEVEAAEDEEDTQDEGAGEDSSATEAEEMSKEVDA